MEIQEYLEDRIAHLKSCELDYFNKSFDEKYQLHEKLVYRQFSNEFEARRKELQLLKEEFLKDENTKQGQTLPIADKKLLASEKELNERSAHGGDDAKDGSRALASTLKTEKICTLPYDETCLKAFLTIKCENCEYYKQI